MVLFVTVLIMFGVFEYGRYLMVLELANNAAREGLRYAVTSFWLNDNNIPWTGTASTNAVGTTKIAAFAQTQMGGVDKWLTLDPAAPTSNPAPIDTVNYPYYYLYRSDSDGGYLGSWDSAATDASSNPIDYPIYLTFSVRATYTPILPTLLSMNSKIPVNVQLVGIAENNK
ncbi:MAG: pilus assembly protein [Gemmataceae bacterium]|nr:pilus assembly protein [Gemmataceae bacterium]